MTVAVAIVLATAVPRYAIALPTRSVRASDVEGIDLILTSGYGLTINFIPTGEVIRQAWIGDPSRIAFTSNGKLCPQSNQNLDCTDNGATVLFLRQIKRIDFPELLSSADGGTQITLITSGPSGQKQYQFRLLLTSGIPKYTALVVQPDLEKQTPIPHFTPVSVPAIHPTAFQPKASILATNVSPTMSGDKLRGNSQTHLATTVPASPPSTTDSRNLIQRSNVLPDRPFYLAVTVRNDANAVAMGLAVAKRKNQITPGTAIWRKSQDAIRLLRRNKSRIEAAKLSGLPLPVLNQLIEWGRK